MEKPSSPRRVKSLFKINKREDMDKSGLTHLKIKKALLGLKRPCVRVESAAALDSVVIDKIRKAISSVAGIALEVEAAVVPSSGSNVVIHLGENLQLNLDVYSLWVKELEKELAAMSEKPFISTATASKHIKRIINETKVQPVLEEIADVGKVIEVGDGIAHITGLRGVGSQELVRFGSDYFGVAFNLRSNEVGCILLDPEAEIEEGMEVHRTNRQLQVPVGEALLGRIVNALGQPIDGKGPVASAKYRFIERKAPSVVMRQPVREPLHTGIKIVDALVPIGRGQRELVIGDRQIGKTTLAVDAILSQVESDVICIYVAIGQKATSVARTCYILEKHRAMAKTIVVAALADDLTALRYYAPYTGCTMGEEFMDVGEDVLIIYDDLSKHAMAYREMSSLLRRPIGRDAYPGDIFYVHSRLLERAAKLRDDLGGGSLTAIPIIETQAGDVSAFIPTNVISICDGQIVLETKLFNEGFRPAMNVGLSVSRVGGVAQTKALKKVAGRLRIDLAQYHEMASFVKLGAELDEVTKAQLARGEKGRELLKQNQHQPLSPAEEAIILYAVSSGNLDDIPVEKLQDFEIKFFEFIRRTHPNIFTQLNENQDWDETVEEELRLALTEFKSEFVENEKEEDAEER